jgi:catechol 2,3-dioxygenase-like lactoylglutathione lyase family enzyme
MKATSITVGIPVRDIGEAIGWYQRVLGIDRGIEPVPGVHEFEVWRGCWLQLFQGEPSSSEHVLRVGVEDIDGERRRLLGLGLAVADTERVEGVIAFCDFADPDGNRLSLYQVLG